MFQLTRLETEQILMCNFCASSLNGEENLKSHFVTSSWGGIRKLPYVFTESGIYMLMTVLKGELAVKQSRMLIRTFRAMKDYIAENKLLLDRREDFIANKVLENDEKIKKIDAKVNKIANEITDVIKKSEVSPAFLDFAKTAENREFLFLNGEAVQAKEAYLDIYKNAKEKIYIVDNYANIKTLHLLQTAKQNLKVAIYTDNFRNYLRKSDLEDFRKERPDLDINFIKTHNKIHDRFIILDGKKIYQCGGSSKDLGNKITSIHEITDDFIKTSLLAELAKLNLELKLR